MTQRNKNWSVHYEAKKKKKLHDCKLVFLGDVGFI